MMYSSELNREKDNQLIQSRTYPYIVGKDESLRINLRYENLDEVEKEIHGSKEFLDKSATDLWQYFYLRQTVKIKTNESKESYIGVDFSKVVHMEVEYDN